MPRNRYDGYIPDPTDRISVDDFFAIKFPEGAQLDNWRKQLTLIRGEVLEIAERGSQQGLSVPSVSNEFDDGDRCVGDDRPGMQVKKTFIEENTERLCHSHSPPHTTRPHGAQGRGYHVLEYDVPEECVQFPKAY